MFDRACSRYFAAPVAFAIGVLIGAPAHGQCGGVPPSDAICIPHVLPGAQGSHYVEMDVSTATPDLDLACHHNAGHTVWFQVSPLVDSLVTFSTCTPTTTYDTVVQAWLSTGDCENPQRVDTWCNDDDPAPACYNDCSEEYPRASIVTVQATAGTTYLFQVGSFNQNNAGCGLCLGVEVVIGPPPPINDDCPDAINVGEGAVSFDTTGAMTDGPALPGECDEGWGLSFVQDIWYRYTASCTGVATVDLCASSYDTRLAVYATNGFPGDLIVCNDDSCGTRSRAQFQASSGAEYFIRVGGYAGAGTGTMAVACSPHVYLDLTRFEEVAAERGFVVRSYEDFSEAVIPDPPGEVEMNDPLDDTTENGVFAPGDIAGGLVLQSNLDGPGEGGPNPRGEGGLVAALPVPTPNPAVGANVGPDGLDILFGLFGPIPDEVGIGIGVADLGGTGEIYVSIYDINGDLLTQMPVLDQPAGFFVGAIPINIPSPGEPVQVGRVNIWAPGEAREGVYEITTYAPPPPCPADIDLDNDVDFQDLLILLAAWGPCPGCPADVDFDDDVDFQDLLVVLAAWGPCTQ